MRTLRRLVSGWLRPVWWLLLVSMTAATAAELKPDEDVMFFPTVGRHTARGWEVDVHAWVFEPGQSHVRKAVLMRSLGLRDLSPDERRIFDERCRYFLVDNERGKFIAVGAGGKTRRLTMTGPNGHTQTSFLLPPQQVPGTTSASQPVRLRLPLSPERSSAPHHAATIWLLREEGISVISDLDDTIKVSSVRDRHELIRNTFCRAMLPVDGMAEVYRAWAEQHGAAFHYVSASPWQLYPALNDFLETNRFPGGSVHLKLFRVKDETFLDLFRSPESYKLGRIEPLLKDFPRRQFILVGDSGEKDPEIYGILARKYPARIAHVFIRDVTDEPATSERYRVAFKGVAPEAWTIFKLAAEIKWPPPETPNARRSGTPRPRPSNCFIRPILEGRVPL